MKIKKLPLVTVLAVTAIGISYILQMAPSPILGVLREGYQLGGNDALLNLCVSIIYPMTIVASILGGKLEGRIGTRRLFNWALVFLAAGTLLNFAAGNYMCFLAGRVLFSIGFGLAIPFIGFAIMNWYGEKGRARMNTLNGMFPFIGTVISFALMLPLTGLLGGSWKASMGIWSIPLLVILALWLLLVREQDLPAPLPEAGEAGVYGLLLRHRDIRLLCEVFVLDFFCYSYIVVLLPTFLAEAGGMGESQAGLWAALAFPAVGIAGGALGGFLMSVTGMRKPILAAGQIVKLAGILLLTLGIDLSVWVGLAGAAVYGLGNGMWMPVMYAMPMEMAGMTPSRVGAAFALISSCGFAAGFVSPVLGGWLTTALAAASSAATPVAQHVFGLKWSLFAFGFTNLLSFLIALLLKDTAPVGRRSHVA